MVSVAVKNERISLCGRDAAQKMCVEVRANKTILSSRFNLLVFEKGHKIVIAFSTGPHQTADSEAGL